MVVWYRLTLLCGAIPLIAGCTVFLAWYALRETWLMSAGMSIIGIGMLFFVAGLFCLMRFHKLAKKQQTDKRRAGWNIAIALGLLLINFPAGVAIIAAVIAIETRYVVRVVNESSETVEDFVVFGGGVQIGKLPPKSRFDRWFAIEHDDTLKCRGIYRGQQFQVLVDGYVTGSLGGESEIRILPNGTVTVSRIPRAR